MFLKRWLKTMLRAWLFEDEPKQDVFSVDIARLVKKARNEARLLRGSTDSAKADGIDEMCDHLEHVLVAHHRDLPGSVRGGWRCTSQTFHFRPTMMVV